MKYKPFCIDLICCIECVTILNLTEMNDRITSGNMPIESFSVYKFEPDNISRNQTRLTVWKNLTSPKAYKLIPSNYKICDEGKIKSKDYYLIINLKEDADNICYYFIKND